MPDHQAIRPEPLPGRAAYTRGGRTTVAGKPALHALLIRMEVRTMEDRSALDTEPVEEVVSLEDAALLTKGNTNSSVENKRSPYGA